MALPSIKNSVGMAVTAVADAGVGTLTVGAALSGGYQTAGSAHGADVITDFRFEEGNTWETAIDCTFDYSEGTITRGTQTGGSSGPSTRVAFTTAAKVYEILDETRIKRAIGGYLEHASHDGSAAVTGVVGTLHVFTGLTADRNFTLPASAQAGDRIGITFPAGSASYEILLKSASGDKINNVDCSSTEWSRLFIAGETVIFRCVDASTVDWVVEYDGRIPQIAAFNGNHTHTSSGSFQLVDLAAASVSKNVGGMLDVSVDKVTPRRVSAYLFTIFVSQSLAAADKVLTGSFRLNGTTYYTGRGSHASIASTLANSSSVAKNIAIGDYIEIMVYQNDSASEDIVYDATVLEIL